MNYRLPFTFVFACLSSLCIAHAQTATTDPVGVMEANVNDTADQQLGIPFLRPPTFVSAVDTVSSNTVNVTATVPDVTTEVHYIHITSGTLKGNWYEVTSKSNNSITVTEDLQAAGLAASDSFDVRPFWTLDTLFPNGGDIPQSSDGANPDAVVMLINPTDVGVNITPSFSYFYHDGSVLAEGWYINGTATTAGNTIISPEAYIIIRNMTSSVALTTFTGNVPTSSVVTELVSRSAGRQDNLVYNPYPVPMKLADSQLVVDGVVRKSPDGANPLDVVLVFSTSNTTRNATPVASYFYHDGSVLDEGWYINGSATKADNVVIPAGAAFIVRRGIGADKVLSWNPSILYSVN